MGKQQVIQTPGKRPADATPQKALELSKVLSVTQIGILWGISRQRVYQLIQKAKEKQVGGVE